MKHSHRDLHQIEQELDLEFKDIGLLEQALVHDSFVSEFPGVFEESNERLEFLGDSVLDLVVAEELTRRFPDRPEGALTQMRSSLVDKAALAELGRKLDLGKWLVMGKGEEEIGGAARDSNLADAFEALLGALFLDGGYGAAREFALRAMSDALDAVAEMNSPPRHPKSLLHEAAREQGFTPPVYEELGRSGPDHSPTFVVQALVNGRPMGRGEGGSKQAAEAEAASAALESIESEGKP
ncbi:MAG: ribonuclease III [Dehalococcoidia bacterium]|nr:ribonuclease III [Dehalococcoidia bacterium]